MAWLYVRQDGMAVDEHGAPWRRDATGRWQRAAENLQRAHLRLAFDANRAVRRDADARPAQLAQ
jgi:hypothetical protein